MPGPFPAAQFAAVAGKVVDLYLRTYAAGAAVPVFPGAVADGLCLAHVVVAGASGGDRCDASDLQCGESSYEEESDLVD
ncbi:hypothetical protein BGZ52_006919, partial [Haplosporangium bisporale]